MFSYYGSKSKIAHRYPRPQHPIVIEPFAGAAHYACLHAIRGNIEKAILIEKNPRIAAVWRWLIQASEEEVATLPTYGFQEYIDHPDRAVRDFLRIQHNPGGGKPLNAHRAISTFPNGSKEGVRKRNEKIASLLKHIRNFEIIQGGYHLAPDIEATWFVDPPYQYAGGHAYDFGSDRIPYDDLARKVKSWRGLKIVCEGDGADWLPFRSFIKGQAQQGKQSKELIYIGRRRARVA